MEEIYAAADIGGTNVRVSLANKNGILTKVSQKTRKVGENTAVPDQIFELSRYVCYQKSIPCSSLAGIGVSTASPFEIQAGKISLKSPNLCGKEADDPDSIPNDWDIIPLEEELEKNFKEVHIANDAISSVVAERYFGAGGGEDNLVYITWSTGIGAGAFVDGNLLEGKNNNAMHGGHIFLSIADEEQPRCGCGDYGHLEAYVSGMGLERRYGASAEKLFSDFREGKEAAVDMIEEGCRIFARGIASITSLVDPKIIIIGGSIANYNWNILYPRVSEHYYSYFPPLTKGVALKQSGLKDYLGDLAALCMIIPDEWIEGYQEKKPWLTAPPTVSLS